MGSFLSSVSGQFAKGIVLGILFPVVLFVIALATKVLPMAGLKPQALLADMLPWETDSTLVALTVFVLILTFLLYSLNTPIIRLYEGYPWQFSYLGRWRKSRHERRYRTAERVLKHARTLDWRAKEAHIAAAITVDLADLRTEAAKIGNTFPDHADIILPTRLGNVIRAFEVYPKIRYGIQAIPAWPRLAQLLPAEKAAPIDDAKSLFDFMLNSSVLSALACILLTSIGLGNDHPVRWTSAMKWAPWAAAFLLLSYLFYLGAINRAAAWGAQVKSVFDLCRFELLEALGYKMEISGPEAERAWWEEISYQLIYPNNPNLPKLPYRLGQTALTVRPLSVVMDASRKAEANATASDKCDVAITVQNIDGTYQTAKEVIVTEKIGKGLRVSAGSPKLENVAAETSCLNPLTVRLGEFKPGEKKLLTYTLEKQG